MIDPYVIQVMQRELVKEALPVSALRGVGSGAARLARGGVAAARAAAPGAGRYLARSAGNIGAGMGVGAAVGGAAGALKSGREAYQRAEEEGGSKGVAAAMGALRGGARGASIGTAVGGAAGLLSGGKGSDLVQKAIRGDKNPLGMAARSGQRKLHSVTGLVPGGAARGTDEYVKALTDINVAGLGDHAKAIAKAEQAKQTAQSSFNTAAQAVQSGQTSLVGLAKGLKDKGIVQGGKELVQQGVGNQWRNSGAMGKAMMVGAPLSGVALAAMNKGDPEDPNDTTRGANVGGAIGSSVAGALTPLIGSTGGEMVAGAGRAVGSTVGKGISKLVGAVRRPNTNALGGGAATPGAAPGLDSPIVERIQSNAALGKPPEDLMT